MPWNEGIIVFKMKKEFVSASRSLNRANWKPLNTSAKISCRNGMLMQWNMADLLGLPMSLRGFLCRLFIPFLCRQ